MKNFLSLNYKGACYSLLVFAMMLLSSCQDDLKTVMRSPSDVTLTLTASAASIVLDTAKASTTVAETFSWNKADYGTALSVTYTLQLDSAHGTFQSPVTVVLDNVLSQDYTKKALNDLAISLRLVPDVSGQIQARVKAEVSTAVEPVFSNTITLTITPYSTKPTPKFPVPDNLFLVGDATPGGWSNPVPTPSQQFTKIDDNTFGIVIQLTGGKQYLLLPKNGDWGHKYNVASGTADPAGDAFAPDAGDNNIPGPAADGIYQIIVDFVKGTYAVTLLTDNPVPANLFIVGDATPGGWTNPVPTPSQQFTQVSNAEFQLTISLIGGKQYLFLPTNGDWEHKYGGTSKTGGALLADNDVPSSNTPSPDATGNFLLTVNFLANTYTVSPQ